MNVNKVLIVGRVTKEIEAKSTPAGTMIVNFSLATNSFYKNDKGEKVEKVEFHNVVAFGKLSEIINKYVKKGQLIYIEGRLSTSSWEKDGKKYYRTDIIAEQMQMGPGPKEKEEIIET
jgi:single-strand DNA-binding protein